MSAERDYQAVVDALKVDSGVEQAKMFGSHGLSVRGKYFAMLHKGRMVVKLPAERVQSLISSGEGVPFDPGHGRLMREWIALEPANARRWRSRAEEARDFVASAAGVQPRKRPSGKTRRTKSGVQA